MSRSCKINRVMIEMKKTLTKANLFKQTGLLIFLSVLLFGCWCPKSIKTFQYNGKPVHPLLLRELLPSLTTNQSIKCLDWKSHNHPETITTITEDAIANNGMWSRSYFSQTGFAEYHIVGVYKKRNCVIFSESDGTLSRVYVMFISLNCKTICLDGFVEVNNLRDDLVRISNGNLFVDSTKYSIKKILSK